MKFFLSMLSLTAFFTSSYAADAFHIERWKTHNGAQVVFYQAMEVPMLDISVAFAAGSAYDGEKFGLSTLTTDLLNQGNAGLSADAIAERLADTGAQYSGENSRDMTVFSLKSLTRSDALKKAVETFTLILAKPDFNESAFLREKNQQLMAIAQVRESPNDVANQMFFKVLYQDHPYAHPVIGTKETVESITLNDVRQFYKKYFVAHNAVIVLVGAISETKAKELAEIISSGLPSGQTAGRIENATPLAETMDIEIPFPSSQTVIRLGQLGIDHHDKHFFPLLVGNYVLGGGSLVSQLAMEVREKRGLTYGVYSQFLPLPGIGPFIITLSTKNSQAPEALMITRKMLGEFIKNGPSDEELSAAKEYLIGSFPLSLASNQSIASMLLKIAFYHLPENYLDTYVAKIKAVNAAEIKEAFQQKISPDKLLQVTVGTP